MNIRPTLSLMAVGALLAPTLKAATLIEFNFDEQLSATQYSDQSGNGRTVTFNRNVTISTSYPFADSDPELAPIDRSGRTLYNLTTSASVANVSGINLRSTNNFTMEGWVYLTGFASISDTPTGGTLWTMGSTTGGTSTFSLRYTAAGTVQATFNALSQSGGTRVFNTDVTLDLNEWTHLAYVKTGNSVDIYVNGIEVSSFQEAGITSRSLPTALSSISMGGNIYGYFDDFRLSDAALTAEQLGYHAPFTTIPEPSAAGLMFSSGLAAFGLLARRKKQG